MAGYVIWGTLAAFGLLSALWVLVGWILPEGKGCAFVCFDIPDEGIVARYRWLRSIGLLHCPLLVVTQKERIFLEDAEICRGEQLLSRLEWERQRFHGAGDGDPTGRSQRRGVSEL